MFTVLILVCSIHLAPSDCRRFNADQVVAGPEAPDEARCGLYGQAFAAELASIEIDRTRQYLKFECERSAIGKGNVG